MAARFLDTKGIKRLCKMFAKPLMHFTTAINYAQVLGNVAQMHAHFY